MPDYMFLLESRLSPEQRAVMLRVQELSAALGFNVYLTGGTVRDLVTGASLRDLDFTVEGNPSKIAHELEKGGAKILHEDEKFRHVELLFAGDCEGSISAARDDHYVRPGTRPEIRWSTIMEDLRRRDFSLNAIAISLNPASRGLLLDPTNGLSDIERAEVRALTIHSFTNQPVRLLRVLRYAARMGFKIEQRTQEWFDLAIERNLQETIAPEDAGDELRALDQIAYLMAESNKSAALSKIRAFLNKWRPIRIALPAVVTELEALGMARGPKFDAIVEQVFAMQLTGRGKTKEEREKILRKLSGIKEQPKKKEKEKKPSKGTDKAHAAAAMGDAAHKKHAAAKAEAKQAAKGKPVPAKAHAKHIARAPRGKSASSGKKSHGRR